MYLPKDETASLIELLTEITIPYRIGMNGRKCFI